MRASSVRSGAASSRLFFQNERLSAGTQSPGSASPSRAGRTRAPPRSRAQVAPAGTTTRLGPAARRVRARSSPTSSASVPSVTATATPSVTASSASTERARRARSEACTRRANI